MVLISGNGRGCEGLLARAQSIRKIHFAVHRLLKLRCRPLTLCTGAFLYNGAGFYLNQPIQTLNHQHAAGSREGEIAAMIANPLWN